MPRTMHHYARKRRCFRLLFALCKSSNYIYLFLEIYLLFVSQLVSPFGTRQLSFKIFPRLHLRRFFFGIIFISPMRRWLTRQVKRTNTQRQRVRSINIMRVIKYACVLLDKSNSLTLPLPLPSPIDRSEQLALYFQLISTHFRDSWGNSVLRCKLRCVPADWKGARYIHCSLFRQTPVNAASAHLLLIQNAARNVQIAQ